METMEAITSRKSTRAYKQEQIPDAVLNTIMAAGCAEPVGSGKYDSLHITVVQGKTLLDKISDAIFEMLKGKVSMSFGAPTMIIASSMEAPVPGLDFANVACVLENMVIAATDIKVDSILYGGPAFAVRGNDELRKALGIPDGFNPLLCVALGYAVDPEEPPQRNIELL